MPGCKKRNPHHLRRPDRQADESEQCEVQDHHGSDAEYRMRRVDIAFDPVVRCAITKPLTGFIASCLGRVKIGALPNDFGDAEDLRAVRIIRRLTSSVVFAVNGGPLLCLHTRCQPEPKSEEMACDRMQVECARCAGVPMQVNGHCRNGDMGESQRDQERSPTMRKQRYLSTSRMPYVRYAFDLVTCGLQVIRQVSR
jgi:hypothetical protein